MSGAIGYLVYLGVLGSKFFAKSENAEKFAEEKGGQLVHPIPIADDFMPGMQLTPQTGIEDLKAINREVAEKDFGLAITYVPKKGSEGWYLLKIGDGIDEVLGPFSTPEATLEKAATFST